MRHRTVAWAWVVTLAFIAAGCRDSTLVAPPPSDQAVPTREGGTVTVSERQFPKLLNTKLTNELGTWRVLSSVLARGYRYTPEFTYEPWLFDGDCQVASPAPFTVTCRIVKDAKWSDGTDLTAEDFKFTAETVVDPKNKIVNREGFDKVDRFTVKDPKSFEVVFTEPRPSFRDMWAAPINATLPKHLLAGTDFNTVWNEGIWNPATKQPIASGPFMVESFTPSASLTLVRNPAYWGRTKPKLDSVVVRAFSDNDQEINALASGGVDVIVPPAQVDLKKKIAPIPDVVFDSALGPAWEHFDMLAKGVPGLDDIEVRKAIATALPRQRLVDQLVKPSDDRATVLHNAIYMTNQKEYQPHWAIYPEAGDPVRASQMLERAGYVKGSDGVYARGGVKLSFDFGVVSTNENRVLAQKIIQEGLKAAGIELRIEGNEPAFLANKQQRPLVNDARPFDYQVTIAAWTGGPDPGAPTFWREDRIPTRENPVGQNFTAVRHSAVTELIKRADAELDPARRASLYNEADALLAREGVSSIPLYQRPQAFSFRNTLTGPRNNPTNDGPMWNLEEWALKA